MPKLSDEDLIKRVEKDLRKAADATYVWRQDAHMDFRFFSGDQWEDQDKHKLNEERRPIIALNRVLQIVNAVCGLEVANRQEVRYIPRELGDVGVNELATGTAEWIRDLCDADVEESDAFSDLVICGLGVTETHIDYDEDYEGKTCVDRRDPLDMWWDPAARKRGLGDKRWVARRIKMSREELQERWPEKAGDCQPGEADYLISSPGVDGSQPHVEDEIAYEMDMDSGRGVDAANEFHVLDYQWYVKEPAVVALNPMSGELETIDRAQLEAVQRFFAIQGVEVRYHPIKRRRYYRAFICGKTVLENKDGPSQDDFTYQFMTGYRDRTNNSWFGLIRPLRDPQRWANKFFSDILHVLASNAKGGLMAETDAFENTQEAEEDWARADSIIFTKKGALSGRNPKVIPKPPAQYPAGYERLMQFAIEAGYHASGVNLETLGMAQREQAGILEHQRKESVMITLSVLFDGLKQYRRRQGRILLDFIRRYVPEGTIVRVNGDQGQQYVQLLKKKLAQRYDIIVDDAPTSPNQREKVFAILSSLLPHLMQHGIPLPPEILDYAPLPESLIAKWKNHIATTAQEPSPEARLDMAKVGTEQARAKELETQAIKNLADAGVSGTPQDPSQQTAAVLDIANARLTHEKANTERARQDTERAKQGTEQSRARAEQARVYENIMQGEHAVAAGQAALLRAGEKK